MAEKRRRSGTCYCIQLRRAASRVTEQYDAAQADVEHRLGEDGVAALEALLDQLEF